MLQKCCVPGCTGNYETSRKVRVFYFPRDEEYCRKWLSAIPRESFVPSENSRVCECHFEKEDFIYKISQQDTKTVASSWTFEDKRKLLVLLQKYGASNLKIIQEHMSHKSISEIHYICEKHSKLAIKQWCSTEEQQSSETMTKWLDILKTLDNSRRGQVHDVITRVLKYIALYEKRNSNIRINLRHCYLVLSDISNGLASRKLDSASNYFLFECLTKVAAALKAGEIESYMSYLRSTKNLEDEATTTLNPLGIPKTLLEFSNSDKRVDVFKDVL